MNYSPDPFVDCDPDETREPLQEIPKSKSTQRKTIAALWLYGIEEGKIHTSPTVTNLAMKSTPKM
jgi:hypothetical protein